MFSLFPLVISCMMISGNIVVREIKHVLEMSEITSGNFFCLKIHVLKIGENEPRHRVPPF